MRTTSGEDLRGRAVFQPRVGRERDRGDVRSTLGRAHAPDEQLLEVFSGLVFAILGSVGLTLGWSLMLAVTNKMEHEDPRHIVSEALRMYPIAWMLARTPAMEHDVLGEHVTPKDAVIVSPYAIGRNPRLWDAPNEFRPRRWAGTAVASMPSIVTVPESGSSRPPMMRSNVDLPPPLGPSKAVSRPLSTANVFRVEISALGSWASETVEWP